MTPERRRSDFKIESPKGFLPQLRFLATPSGILMAPMASAVSRTDDARATEERLSPPQRWTHKADISTSPAGANSRRLPVAEISSDVGSSERERAPLCGVATIEETELGGMSDADAAGESVSERPQQSQTEDDISEAGL